MAVNAIPFCPFTADAGSSLLLTPAQGQPVVWQHSVSPSDRMQMSFRADWAEIPPQHKLSSILTDAAAKTYRTLYPSDARTVQLLGYCLTPEDEEPSQFIRSARILLCVGSERTRVEYFMPNMNSLEFLFNLTWGVREYDTVNYETLAAMEAELSSALPPAIRDRGAPSDGWLLDLAPKEPFSGDVDLMRFTEKQLRNLLAGRFEVIDASGFNEFRAALAYNAYLAQNKTDKLLLAELAIHLNYMKVMLGAEADGSTPHFCQIYAADHLMSIGVGLADQMAFAVDYCPDTLESSGIIPR